MHIILTFILKEPKDRTLLFGTSFICVFFVIATQNLLENIGVPLHLKLEQQVYPKLRYVNV